MDLIFWRVVQLRIVPLTVSVVEEVVVHQVPAPALVVRPQQGHVAVTLGLSILGGDPYHCHRPQRSFPDHLPRVTTAPEPNLTTCSIRALGNWVSVEGEPVGFDVDVVGAISWVPRVIECA